MSDSSSHDLDLAHDIFVKLQSAKQWEHFLQLPPSHRKEYTSWIDEAKKPETRAKRIQKMCEMLATDQKAR